MKERKINGHESAAARFLYDEQGSLRGLKSYNTVAVIIDADGWLTVNGLYSMTTIKHIGWFMRAIGYSYQFAKALYNDGEKYNVFTGELEAV